MRRSINVGSATALAVCAAGALSLAVIAPASARIQVDVNERTVAFRDVQPQEINGRVFIPLRDVAEALNAEVSWNNASQTVNGERAGKTFAIPIGSHNANVNGRSVNVDQPARLIHGRTLVPLRFAAEALGAEVAWHPADQRVAISLAGSGEPGGDTTSDTTIPASTVVQAQLDDRLTSRKAQVGDRFTATLDPADSSRFPDGTKFEGHVTEAQTATKDRPGVLDAAFDKAVLPNGNTVRISGNLAGLDKDSVRKTADGRLEAKKKSGSDFDWKWVGYGTGAGLILGGILGDNNWLKGALLGGAGGAIYAYLNKNKGSAEDKEKYHEVVLKKGSKFGIVMNDQVALNLR
jgi:hypothetical protein